MGGKRQLQAMENMLILKKYYSIGYLQQTLRRLLLGRKSKFLSEKKKQFHVTLTGKVLKPNVNQMLTIYKVEWTYNVETPSPRGSIRQGAPH